MRATGAGLRVAGRAAVLGRPVAHSLSPALHQAAYAALGLHRWRYEAIECDEDRLPGLLAGLEASEGSWVGLSLTMPLKRAALRLSGSAHEVARGVGAANTLLPRERGWHAENTDVAGLQVALTEAGVSRVRRGLILGAGGTAQAALAALAALGERTPTVLVREPSRTGDLAAAARRLDVRPVVRRWPAVLDPDWDVLVSTVPAGAADRLAAGPWPPRGVVLDVVYAPWPTALALGARAGGCIVVGGGDVLLHQAAAQVELMTGRTAPLVAMRAALPAPLRR